MFEAYRANYPELANEIELMQRRELPTGWDHDLPVFPPDGKGIAGRDASGKVLNLLAQNIPWFLGGSADLGGKIRRYAPVAVSRKARDPDSSSQSRLTLRTTSGSGFTSLPFNNGVCLE